MKYALMITASTLALLSGCNQGSGLSVTGGEPVTYLCEQGKKIQISYFGLSDDSLNFLKLSLPNGKDYTLPQIVSGSGVRYTDEFEAGWRGKGNEGYVEMLDKDGEWQTAYNDCKQQQ